MRVRNSFRLLLNNFKSTYVILLFKVLTALITGALTVVILASGFEFLTESAELEAFFSALGDIPAAFFTSASFADFDILLREALENVIAAFKDILLLLQGNIAG
ncbi:MAG: hypothetical protein IJY26_02380, partial [Clostridia bacterium]|nr:hypothetical protein [Clostridia bacterium]